MASSPLSRVAGPRRNRRRSRGFTLIEALVSVGIFAIGAVGVIQMQILSANQNGIARRTSRAASIARDFTEVTQRWELFDERLSPPVACGTAWVDFPLSDALLGSARAPAVLADFTATPSTGPYASSHAGSEGRIAGALGLGTRPYEGAARPGKGTLLGVPDDDRIQLLYSSRWLNTDSDASTCEALLVSVAVRYRLVGETYRNFVTSFIKYNPGVIVQGALEQM